jgi:hypothetical protein
MILKMGMPREIASSSSPSRLPPITVTRGAMGSIGSTTGSKRAGCGRRQFQVWRMVAYFNFRDGKFAVGYRAVGDAPCERAAAHSMLAKNSRVYAGDFPSAHNGTRGKHHVQTHKAAGQDAPIAQAANAATAGRGLGRWRHLFIAGTTLN